MPMFGPNLNGDEPHWIIGALFASVILGLGIGLPAIIIWAQ